MTSWKVFLCLSICLLTPPSFLGADSPKSRPNILLFIADDVGWNDYGCYGNSAARTPNIDQLASQGILFENAFLTASSCSPSRASIVTGRYPHNTGKAAELHLPIASNLPWFPELLREAGYYTVLSGKNHMRVDEELGDDGRREPAFDVVDSGRTQGNSGGHANWVKLLRERPKGRPFFGWFAAYDAHRGWDADRQWDETAYGPQHRPQDVRVPPFLIDNLETRQDLASYYNEVTRFDFFIGRVVDELRRQSQLENTLIIVMADNGRPFPRAKTRLHDSGMKTALVMHWPAGIAQHGRCQGLVSAIDLAPTVLGAAGVDIPVEMQGLSLQPILQDVQSSPRKYAFSEHNWHDYEAHGRSVRDGQFLYIKNNRPYLAWQGPADSVRSPSHLSLQQGLAAAKLTPSQQDVFLSPRPVEELYAVGEDPDQLHNLVADKAYSADLQRLRGILERWAQATHDSVPVQISSDSFDRETGEALKLEGKDSYRHVTPGEDRRAWQVNQSGPR